LTGRFDAVVGLEEIVDPIADAVADRIWERTALRLCRTCDSRPPPPHDEDAEDRVLSALLFAEAGQTFPGFEAAHVYGLHKQRAALVLLRGVADGAPLSPTDALRALCEAWPQLSRQWAGVIARLEYETPAYSLDRIAEDIERLRVLAAVRTLLSTLAELDLDARGGRLVPEDIYKRGAAAFAPFRPKANP
jgi:hypothetical protein